MKFLNSLLFVVVGLVFAGVISYAASVGSGHNEAEFFYRCGASGICTKVSTWTLGSAATPISAAYLNSLLVNTKVAGHLNMAGFDVLNADAFEGNYFFASSTATSSLFSGRLQVNGTTTLNEGINIGNAATDKISLFGELDTGIVFSATSTAILIDLEKATTTAATEIRMSSGARIMTGAGPAGSGSTTDGSLYVATSTSGGYGLWVNIGNYWFQVATTSVNVSE